MNLELGPTTWLNVSPKLLIFHEWFFTRFEDMPREVYEEFKHHSHAHDYAAFNTSSVSHNHGVNSTSGACVFCSGVGYHFHNITSQDANDHLHAVAAGTTGASNLGSPWWNHTHTIIVPTGNGGAVHSHSRPANSDSEFCAVGYYHYHVVSGDSGTNDGGAVHNHSISGNTNTADPTGTPEIHVHVFLFWSATGDPHQHTFPTADRWKLNSANCGVGANHLHGSCTSPVRSNSHVHQISGTTQSGGEPLPAVAQPIGDGFTFAI